MSSAETNDKVTISHDAATHRFILSDGEIPAGYAEYRDEDGRRVFTHTVVDSAFEGQGFGSRLARFVLDDAKAQGKRIVPVCSFIAAYVKRHHDYDDLLDWPEPREGGR